MVINTVIAVATNDSLITLYDLSGNQLDQVNVASTSQPSNNAKFMACSPVAEDMVLLVLT